MDEIIKRHRAMVAERLTQGFSPVHQDTLSKAQEGFDDIEKARVVRQDGDIHPNGKWVWSSQAAGGKGDWRVIKKPKDGSPAPAPAKKETKSEKKETKSDNGAASKSSEALAKTLDNMSVEELTELESIIASAVDKKTAGKKTSDKKGAKNGFAAEVERVLELAEFPSESVEQKARDLFLSIGDKFGDRTSMHFYANHSPYAVIAFGDLKLRVGFQKDGKSVMTSWDLLNFEEDGGELFSAEKFDVNKDFEPLDDFLSSEIRHTEYLLGRMKREGATEEDMFTLTEKLREFESAKSKYKGKVNDLGDLEALHPVKKTEAPTPAAPEVSEPAKTKKQDDKEFRNELKRAIEEGHLNSQQSKNKVESICKSIRKRFGDKASVKLTEHGQPVVRVTFGDLELNVSYREDKRFGDEVTTQWTLSGYDSDTSYNTKARKFKTQDDLYPPDVYLSLLKMRAKDKLKSLEAQGSSSRADIDHIKSELKRIESAEEGVSNEFTF